MQTISIPRRFRGPTESANGGYFCGRLAALARQPVTVRLVRPPPLDSELTVVEPGAAQHPEPGAAETVLEVRLGDTLLASARPGEVGALDVPPPPSLEQAADAASRYAGFTAAHPAPECFVCGPTRGADALRIYCGRLGADGLVAAPWTPSPSFAAGGETIGTEIVWAALDCPGFAAAAPDMRSMLLGELTARIDAPVLAGEPCVVVGWPISASGRKHEAGTALYGAGGELKAVARAIWIEPRG